MRRCFLPAVALAATLLLAPGVAQAAKSCKVPVDGEWDRISPAEAGMSRQKLQDAVDYGSQNLSFAVRVFRRGCLVYADRAEALNNDVRYESWSLSKSVTSTLFGAAMTDGAISPDDPLGSLLPEADRDHGEITMRDLLTMSSGLRWNGLRDYNIFTMPDRVRDALTLPVVRKPGTYYEYAQSAVALVAKAIERATGEDARAYLQREVLDHLGIEGSSWDWERDEAGNIEGFHGARMTPGDFGRLGELFRRGGRWRGERLLSREYLQAALSPAKTNGCYGWLIWLAAKSKTPCIGPRVVDRPVTRDSGYPGMPHDMFVFSGLFGQLVAVFPSQEIVLVRTGLDPALVNPTGGKGWQHGLYSRVLGAVTDEKVRFSKEFEGEDLPNEDGGFGTALREPDQYSQGAFPEPLPPAGPPLARAASPSKNAYSLTRRGSVRITVRCPARWPGAGSDRCRGVARLQNATSKRYDIPSGEARKLAFRLEPARPGRASLLLRNRAAGGSTKSRTALRIRR